MTTTSGGETVADETLAEAVARRDQPGGSVASARSALEQLYRRHGPLLLAFLLARSGRSEAEDLHQAVWLRVWQKLPEAQPGPFKGWLYQVARRLLIDHLRKKRPGPLDEAEAVVLPDGRSGSPEVGLVDRERTAALEACLAGLSEQAVAVVKARLSGESYETIAGALRIRPDRAYQVFYKAKEALKSCVERALS